MPGLRELESGDVFYVELDTEEQRECRLGIGGLEGSMSQHYRLHGAWMRGLRTVGPQPGGAYLESLRSRSTNISSLSEGETEAVIEA